MGFVKTNIGEIPLSDYYEIIAMQNGFSSYAEMQEEGLSIVYEDPQKRIS